MEENIVGSLFGVSPQQLSSQRQQSDANNAFRFANLSPMERAQYAIYQGGAGLGRGVQGLLGGDPEMEKASKIRQLAGQFDLSTPQGARDFGRALQPFAPTEAMKAMTKADAMEQAQLSRQKTAAGISKTELSVAQEEQLRAELAALGPNATEQQVLNVVTKYGSADRILRELTASRDRQSAAADRRAKAAGGEDGVGQPGPVGKGGAYRDITGQILGPSEMKTVRQEFEGAQKLLDTLNQVKPSDVKDAQSYVDWTTKGETKALASKKTLMAQTKIAASQLMEQINQLPPGSASDADMRASMKSFPGYSDADALAAWVNETKRKLQSTINRGQDQFGFKARVTATDPINLKPVKPSAGSIASDDNALINKYLKAKTQ
jgi:hypothetical protein